MHLTQPPPFAHALPRRANIRYSTKPAQNRFPPPGQHTEIHKRRTVEWETKCASAHSDAALKRLLEYSGAALAPFDRLVRELQVRPDLAPILAYLSLSSPYKNDHGPLAGAAGAPRSRPYLAPI